MKTAKIVHKFLHNVRIACTHAVRQRRAFVIAFSLIVFTLWLTAIICSYHSHDRSLFFYRTDNAPVKNLGGLVGANVAALLFYLFGIASYVILCLFFFCTFVMIKRKNLFYEFDRLLAWALFIPAFSALAAMYHFHALAGIGGGKIGTTIYSLSVRLAENTGAAVLLWALAASSFIVIAHHYIIVFTQQTIAGILFLKKQQKIQAYSRQAAQWIFFLCSLPIVYLHRLFSGNRVAEYARSIVLLEHECNEQEAAELEAVAQDTFWKSYLQNTVNTSNRERTETPQEATLTPLIKHALAEETIYTLPTFAPFSPDKNIHHDKQQQNDLERKAKLLEEKLSHFGIKGTVVGIKRGPVVTLFEYQPEIDSRISKITALEDDLALALQALSIRIIAPIPGTAVIGFEVANNNRESVPLAELMNTDAVRRFTGSLPLVLGKDTVGNNVVVDLAKMPHLLIAGSTGSGKSVALHSILMSLLCTRTPDELRLILIDPKRLEFAAYNDIGHLLFPIITNAKQAINALRWVVGEMEQRYETMKQVGARSINDYHTLCEAHTEYTTMPFIVVIIDELADLMMVGGRDIEDLLTRITQMARAAGIHVLVATQRPSVDVITGVIKVNFPSRISFRVTSKVDSRTILDCNGAEKLLGRGDMLLLDAADSFIRRVHGAYVSDKEIATVTQHIREQKKAIYCELDEQGLEAALIVAPADDALYKEIIAFVHEVDEISISLIQRRFRIGYNRSARIIETLEAQGIIAAADGSKMRKVIRQ